MKILCHVCHFYGSNSSFTGKSSTQLPEIRKGIVEECLAGLRQLGDIDIKICAIDGLSLFRPDIDLSHLKETPTQIVYESIYRLMDQVENYDYFICIEDDILLPKETFDNVLRFDKQSFVNEIILPNRLETNAAGEKFCVDLYAMGTWIYQKKQFEGHEIRVARNPHSGLLIVSKEKLQYAISQIDRSFRGLILAAPMASAFAHFHSPFALYRSYNDLDYHYVIHLDKWLYSTAADKNKDQQKKEVLTKEAPVLKLKKAIVKYFVPPGIMNLYKQVVKTSKQ